MAAGLILQRVKPVIVPDPDPTLGIFVPPAAEVFTPISATVRGFRAGLEFVAAGFSARVLVYARDQVTGNWWLAGIEPLTPHRRLVRQLDIGPHDIWIGLDTITGGAPINIYFEEAQ